MLNVTLQRRFTALNLSNSVVFHTKLLNCGDKYSNAFYMLQEKGWEVVVNLLLSP